MTCVDLRCGGGIAGAGLSAEMSVVGREGHDARSVQGTAGEPAGRRAQ